MKVKKVSTRSSNKLKESLQIRQTEDSKRGTKQRFDVSDISSDGIDEEEESIESSSEGQNQNSDLSDVS